MNEAEVRSVGPEALRQRLQAAVTRLREEDRRRRHAARILKSCTAAGVLESLPRLQRLLQALRELGPEVQERLQIADLCRDLEQWAAEKSQRLRSDLGRQLRDAFTTRGLGFRVVSRDDPVEVRIPPLSLRLDFGRSKAVWQFAREPLREVGLDPKAIEKAYDAARRQLEWPEFSPPTFLHHCYQAYREALLATNRQAGDRVEFEHFLPRLALHLQRRSFLRNPQKGLFRDYSRAHFAYDVLRLRRAGQLAHNGWRLNLGVATGSTAQQKERVIYFEDEEGNGEYKLTVFFTRSEETPQGGKA